MKRLISIKCVAVVLAILIAISSFSIIGATAIASNDSKIVKTKTSGDIYKISATTKYGLRFNPKYFPYEFRNQINGKSVEYLKSWGAIEYEYSTNGSTNSASWCIQPGVKINSANYGKIIVDENGKVINPSKANTNYLKQLQNHPKLQKAMAKTIAYGKKKGGTKSDSPYYYAIGLLLWDYIMNIRNTSSPYDVKSGKTSNLNKIYNTNDASRTAKVQDAAKDIIKNMKSEVEPLKTYKEKGDRQATQLYKDVKAAKAVRTRNAHNVHLPNKPNSKGVYKGTSQAKFAKLMKRNDISYTVVNHNGKSTEFTKKISATLNKQGKLEVSTKENLSKRAEKGKTYYIKITKTPKDYTKSKQTVMFEPLIDARQSFINSISYEAKPTTAYFPIYHLTRIEYGSLIINKRVVGNIDGSDIEDMLDGWNFKVEYTANGQKTSLLRTTDSDGSTSPVEDIPENTNVTITELGKYRADEMYATNLYYNIQTFQGKKYAIPIGFTDKTAGSTKGSIRSKTVKIKANEQIDFDYVNEYEQKFKLRVKKETTDGDDVSGYYFAIWDFAKDESHLVWDKNAKKWVDNYTHKRVIKEPKLIGPTDSEGYAYCDLDITTKLYLKTSKIYLHELGKLKKGMPIPSTVTLPLDKNGYVPAFYDKNSDPASRFAIPSKYTTDYNYVSENVTLDGSAIGVTLKKIDIDEFYATPSTYKKDVTVVNRAEGMVKLKKLDAVNKIQLKGAVYGIYEYHQNDGEDNYKGEYDKPSVDTYNSSETEEATKKEENDASVIDDEIVLSNQNDTLTWDLGRINTTNGEDIEDQADNSYYRRTGFVGTDTYNKFNVNVINNSKNILWNVFWYDEDKNFISSYTNDNVPSTSNSAVIAIPENIEYIRIVVYRKDTIDNIESEFNLGHVITFTFSDNDNSEPVDSDISINENNDIKPLCTLTTDNNEWVYSKLLPCGTYYIKEISAPSDKYTVDPQKYTFEIEPGMNTQENALPITRTDKPSNVEFRKYDGKTVSGGSLYNGKLLAGAKINFYEKPANGTLNYDTAPIVYTIESTKADKETSIIAKFDIGKTYIAHEVSAPKGYFLADDLEFTVSTDGSVDEVNMIDEPMEVKISKIDITNQKEIKGCKLKIVDKNSKVIESWTSKDTPHLIEKSKLVEDETYTLIETKPADGYTTAASIDFVVNRLEPTKVVMKDYPTTTYFSKTDITGNKELPGCKMKITDEKGKTLYHWTSTNKPHIIKGKLAINKTYYLVETQPADGYTTAERVKFKVKDTGEIQKVKMKDAPTLIRIRKVAKHDTQLLLGGAKFTIYDVTDEKHPKKVLNFTTKAGKAYTIKGKLVVGRKYMLEETKAPVGYRKAVTKTFVVKDTPKTQTYTVKDAIDIRFKVPQTGGLSDYINYILIAVLLALGLGTVTGVLIRRKVRR